MESTDSVSRLHTHMMSQVIQTMLLAGELQRLSPQQIVNIITKFFGSVISYTMTLSIFVLLICLFFCGIYKLDIYWSIRFQFFISHDTYRNMSEFNCLTAYHMQQLCYLRMYFHVFFFKLLKIFIFQYKFNTQAMMVLNSSRMFWININVYRQLQRNNCKQNQLVTIPSICRSLSRTGLFANEAVVHHHHLKNDLLLVKGEMGGAGLFSFMFPR